MNKVDILFLVKTLKPSFCSQGRYETSIEGYCLILLFSFLPHSFLSLPAFISSFYSVLTLK
jgi:hypothetical protein